MKINKLNKYIQLSELPSEVLDNLSDFSSILITGNINCCQTNCGDTVNTYTLDLPVTPTWQIDLSDAVGLNSIIQELNLINYKTSQVYNVITAPIDLQYIEANCVNDPCTLQDFSGYFAPLFKSQIDTFFTGIGVASNVTITFTGNIVTISNYPTGTFIIPQDIKYGLNEPYLVAPFGYAIVDSPVFLTGEGILYITPEFFNVEKLQNGIYKFTLKFNKEDESGYVEVQNCAFIDIDLACKVASVLHNVLKESKDKSSEQCSTTIHMLHYALINGSNCGCNCEELCQVYKGLIELLNTIDPQLMNDCGC